MRGIVAQMQNVEIRICGKLRDQWPVMAGYRDVTNQAPCTQVSRGIQDLVRKLAIPESEQQDIRVLHVQFAQRALEAPPDQSRYARVRLHHEHEFVTLATQIAECLSEGVAPHAAP